MVYNFFGKAEKHGEISTDFRLKHHCGKENIFHAVYPNENTWQPTLGFDNSMQKLI